MHGRCEVWHFSPPANLQHSPLSSPLETSLKKSVKHVSILMFNLSLHEDVQLPIDIFDRTGEQQLVNRLIVHLNRR